MKTHKLSTSRVLSEKEMAEFRGGAQPCKNGCRDGCINSCLPGCCSGNKDGVILLPEVVITG